MKILKEEGSLLEEIPLKRNLHPMVKWRDGRRKETWYASSARNWDTLNMIILFTKVKPRGERRRQLWPIRVKVKMNAHLKTRRKKWQTCASWQ